MHIFCIVEPPDTRRGYRIMQLAGYRRISAPLASASRAILIHVSFLSNFSWTSLFGSFGLKLFDEPPERDGKKNLLKKEREKKKRFYL